MTYQDRGAVAALQYATKPRLDFADIVEEFDIAFQAGTVNRRQLTWDCDDVAIFDMGGIRVALGWMQPGASGDPWYLIVAVGNSPEAGGACVDPETCDALAARILERTEQYLPSDAVFRSNADRQVDAALIDVITERLSKQPKPADPAGSPWKTPFFGTPKREPDQSTPTRGTDAPGIGLSAENADMRKLREAVCGTTDEIRLSLPMHLSIYTLGMTMLLQAPPVGAALLVYTLLREDFGLLA